MRQRPFEDRSCGRESFGRGGGAACGCDRQALSSSLPALPRSCLACAAGRPRPAAEEAGYGFRVRESPVVIGLGECADILQGLAGVFPKQPLGMACPGVGGCFHDPAAEVETDGNNMATGGPLPGGWIPASDPSAGGGRIGRADAIPYGIGDGRWAKSEERRPGGRPVFPKCSQGVPTGAAAGTLRARNGHGLGTRVGAVGSVTGGERMGFASRSYGFRSPFAWRPYRDFRAAPVSFGPVWDHAATKTYCLMIVISRPLVRV